MKCFGAYLGVLLLVAGTGCFRSSHDCYQEDYQWEEIVGRPSYVCQEWVAPKPVYRVPIPEEWERVPALPDEELIDSRQPIAAFRIVDGDDCVAITVHNFPHYGDEPKIPSSAQVERWKKQMGTIDKGTEVVKPVVHDGFSGLYFSATEKEKRVMAWAMQVAMEHERVLHVPYSYEEAMVFPQMSADYTIKVTGPKQLVNRYEDQIFHFANHLSLIREIPSSF